MKRICLIFAILVFMGSILGAQERRITGVVTDASTGTTMPGVTITVQGTTQGTITDVDGRYEIVATEGATLVFSFVGMLTEERVVGTESVINVAMSMDLATLQEVVVTALGISRESKALGYSVQAVDGDEIVRGANTNPINSLTGRVAGVNITNSSGAAGSSSFMTIRGAASLTGNNQPLFIVDGVPIDNSQLTSGNPADGGNNLLYGVALSNRIVDINPEDIESVSILKGGAATALYGLRAGNGAVIITTKKGQTGVRKSSVSFSSSITVEQVSQLPELNNKFGQGLFGDYSTTTLVWGPRLDTLRFDGGENLYYPEGNIVSMNDPSAQPNLLVGPYDNVGNFFQTGLTYNNTLSFTGGDENNSYRLSIGNTNSTGIVPNNVFERTNISLAGESKLSDRFTTDARISYTNSGGVRIQQGSNTSGVMLALMRMPPNFDITGGTDDPTNDEASYKLPDGRQRNAYAGGGYDNPFWTVNMNQLTDDVNRVTGHAALHFKAAEWLNITYRAGTDLYSDRRKSYLAIGSRAFPAGRVYNEEYFVRDFNSDLILNFNRRLSDDVVLTGLVGHNLFQTATNRVYVQGDQLTVSEFYNVSGAIDLVAFDLLNKKRTSALYGDIGGSFRDMVYLNVTLRNEQSTTLPEENNSFLLYSGNASFVFSELPALKDNSVLPFGKFRISYAEIANDAFVYATLPSFPRATWADGWTSGISFPGFGGLGGFSLGTVLPNNELRPEITKTFEVGADLRFFNNRFGLDISYFSSQHEDLILSVPIAKSSGYYAQALNAGNMENKGIELTSFVVPVQTPDFRWDINVNFTRIRNEVLSLAEGVNNVTLAGFVGAQARAVVGEPYGSIFGDFFETNDEGQLIIEDDPESSNYGRPIYNTGERNLGNVMPDWTMGISNSLTYKGVSLSFLLDIKQGGVMWNGTKGAMYYFGSHVDTESRDDGAVFVFEGVKRSDGSPNDIQVAKDINWYVLGPGSGFTGPTSQFVEKTDWVRLREVTLSYRLSRSLLARTRFQSAEIFITGRNLWLSTPYTGIDPETSLIGAGNGQGLDYFNMPGTSSYVVGLRVDI
ncbi:MAG: SusC/RagA family TonB-linked outer membrane protein [Bacteroidota bacterium]